MSKNHRDDHQNRRDILHLLEYCRIDRAAELLGCEVCDLLHLQDMGKISLHWNFNGQNAKTTLGDIFIAGDRAFQDLETTVHLGEHSVAVTVEGAFINASDGDEDIDVKLYGFWETSFLTQDTYEQLSLDTVSCYAGEHTGQVDSMTAYLPPEWRIPKIELLHVKKNDLARLRKAIDTGEQIEPPSGISHHSDWSSGREEHYTATNGRLTNKQCVALLLALQLAGFTEDDFNNSGAKLKKKIQRKAEELGINNTRKRAFDKYTPASLEEWVRRGGG